MKSQMKSQMKHRSMYALLIAAATMIGITIYGSCSSDDDDYPYLYQEGYTSMANSRMTRSGEESNSGQFPVISAIVNNSTVVSKMNEVWQQTKDAASSSGRSEFGFYIYYNRATCQYSFSEVFQGPIVSCGTRATLNFPGTNNPNVCAMFHTHTTFEYCNNTIRRSTGPSNLDTQSADSSKVSGILFDYKDSVIVGGMSKNLESKVYTYGPERRTY